MNTAISINLIRRDGGTQPRAGLNSDMVEKFAEDIQNGDVFPPVDVFFDGTDYWLADGFHRVQATFAAGRADVDCNVHQGTREDAQWFSFGANKTNGLYRSNADKQRAVKAALQHPKSAGLSDNAIAKHVGVHHDTVSEWRMKLNPPLAESASERRIRQCADGRTINVAAIGRAKSAAQPRLQTPPRQPLQVKADPERVSREEIGKLIWLVVEINRLDHSRMHLDSITNEQFKDLEQASELLLRIVSLRRSADLMETSIENIIQAESIMKADPQLAERMKAGEIDLDAAERLIGEAVLA